MKQLSAAAVELCRRFRKLRPQPTSFRREISANDETSARNSFFSPSLLPGHDCLNSRILTSGTFSAIKRLRSVSLISSGCGSQSKVRTSTFLRQCCKGGLQRSSVAGSNPPRAITYFLAEDRCLLVKSKRAGSCGSCSSEIEGCR